MDGDKVCVITIRNIRGAEIITLPKGHIEQGETAREAALREAEEETGCRCEVVCPAVKIRYSFRADNGDEIRKTVQWYVMRLREVTGRKPDPAEIAGVNWFTFDEAVKKVRYPSDRRLIEMARRRCPPNGKNPPPQNPE